MKFLRFSLSEQELPTAIQEKLKALPNTPGVYEMKNEDDETLYVGKAKNLKNRVKSYFLPSAKHSPRIQKLIEKTQDLTWTETSSEVEALVLETNLIKEKRPKFNILMRDDKNFVYIKVTVNEDFPRIFTVRRMIKDGAKYFGPKTSTSSVHKTIDLLQTLFRFRSTPLEITEESPGKVEVKSAGNTKYPCLNFHLKKCDAPCIGNITKEEYAKKIEGSLRFLKGEYKEVLKDLEEQMKQLAMDGKFELAAKIRDQLFAVQKISEKQLASAPDEFSADIIGTVEKFGRAFFHVFSIREGKIINSETFSVDLGSGGKVESENSDSRLQEALSAFLRDHAERVADSPKALVVDGELLEEGKEVWEDFLREKFEHAVEVSLPQKGKRKKLLDLAAKNALSYAERNAASFIKHNEDIDKTLKTLQEKLGMENFPKRIECYDISHFSGTETVASMVVFDEGGPKTSDYRYFNIKSLERGEIDDFASLQEALTRRLARLPEPISENLEFGKITRKSDFIALRQAQGDKIGGELCSKIAFSEKTLQKVTESYFYGIFDRSSQKLRPTRKKKGAKKESVEKKLIGHAFLQKTSEIKVVKILLFDAPENTKEVFLKSLLDSLSGYEMKVENLREEDVPIFEKYSFLPLSQGEGRGEGVSLTKKATKKSRESLEQVPDLLVIDGGKGQLSSVCKVLKNSPYSEKISICSLAKREEEVFLPNKKDSINIEKNSPEGKLLQQIRDEAHRFAITKNRSDREKSAQKSLLDEISGIGPKTKKQLKEKFGGVVGIRNASDIELLEVVSEKVLKKLRESL
jgi:excinuclease ABC subunit C